MKHISVMTPVYNEEDNINSIYIAVKEQFDKLPQYTYEHIFIDNCSTDKSEVFLRNIAENDYNVKLIFNARNFGPNRSGTYGMQQAYGDALICIVCDLQDPPELIPLFLEKWEEGNKVVYGQKTKSEESKLMYGIRKLYYKIMKQLSETDHIDNVTGFGLMDKEVVDMIRWTNDPDPYIRGLIMELGYKLCLVPYTQRKREHGKSSYNFIKYFDYAITGLTNTSKAPLRIATLLGFTLSAISFIFALFYLVKKLLYWDSFVMGTAPILIGIFFFASVQIALIGLIGEYIGAVLTRVTKRPMVVEKERVNFDTN